MQIKPDRVILLIEKTFGLLPARQPYVPGIKTQKMIHKLYAILLRHVFRARFFHVKELQFIVNTTYEFSLLLNDVQKVSYDVEAEKLRIQAVQSCLFLEGVSLRIELKDAVRVEHYFQNQILDCVPIRDFIKGFEL